MDRINKKCSSICIYIRMVRYIFDIGKFKQVKCNMLIFVYGLLLFLLWKYIRLSWHCFSMFGGIKLVFDVDNLVYYMIALFVEFEFFVKYSGSRKWRGTKSWVTIYVKSQYIRRTKNIIHVSIMAKINILYLNSLFTTQKNKNQSTCFCLFLLLQTQSFPFFYN